MRRIVKFLSGKSVSNLTVIVALGAVITTGWYVKSAYDVISQLDVVREQELNTPSAIYRLRWATQFDKQAPAVMPAIKPEANPKAVPLTTAG